MSREAIALDSFDIWNELSSSWWTTVSSESQLISAFITIYKMVPQFS